jgi:hypothetical protein
MTITAAVRWPRGDFYRLGVIGKHRLALRSRYSHSIINESANHLILFDMSEAPRVRYRQLYRRKKL